MNEVAKPTCTLCERVLLCCSEFQRMHCAVCGRRGWFVQLHRGEKLPANGFLSGAVSTTFGFDLANYSITKDGDVEIQVTGHVDNEIFLRCPGTFLEPAPLDPTPSTLVLCGLCFKVSSLQHRLKEDLLHLEKRFLSRMAYDHTAYALTRFLSRNRDAAH